jgi:3-hydroxyacyl-CoA dehydrogenase/enoyl-CoA hydratase/3-hydroxybutyryl-CoA epimerase
MGPIALADQVGLDIALDVADGLRRQLDTPMPEVPDWLRRKVEEGHLGVKTGRGMYDYDVKGKADKKDVDGQADDALTDRLMLPLVNAAVSCLGQGIVDDADALDGAVIFGTGFAPFRGGPLQYVRQRGVEQVRRRLQELAQVHGPRFTPAETGWQMLVES